MKRKAISARIAITVRIMTVLVLWTNGLALGQFGAAPLDIQIYEAAIAQAVNGATPDAESQTVATDPATTSSSNDSDEEKAEAKRDKERLDAIKKLKFDRRPSTILKLWSTPPQQEKKKAPTTPTQEEVAEKKVSKDSEPKADETEEERETREKEEAEKKAKEQAEKERLEKEQAEKEQFARTTLALTDAVTKGDWERFGETLCDREGLSDKEAIAIYDRMLDQLGATTTMDFTQVVGLSEEMQKFMQQLMGNRRNNPATAYAEKHIINVQDFIGMIRSAPPEVREEANASVESGEPAEQIADEDGPQPFKAAQLQKLSGLMRICLTAGTPIDELVSVLKEASDKLLPAQNVATLLSRAGHDSATSDFLPTIQEASETENVDALNLWAKHYLSLYREEPKELLRLQAWQCTLQALAIDDAEKSSSRMEALTRAVSLAPKLEGDAGEQWLRDSFTKDPQRGQELMAKLGTATSQRLAQMPQDGNMRGENLELQFAAVEAFLETGTEINAQWSGILNLLGSNWLKEAGVTRQHSSRSSYGSSMRRDRYGNLYYVQEDAVDVNQAQQMVLRRINPVKVETILETAPTGVWFDTIDEAFKPQYTAMMCRLWLKVNEGEKAFPYIETLANTNPDTARELAEEFLRVWTKGHNPNQASQRTNSYMFMYGYEKKADKIPLTRSKQERNLKELSGWIERLSKLPLDDELDEKLLVQAFMTCHSVAEVYDVDAIQEVFGAWGQIEAGTMARLVDQMRSNLATVWRDPNVQRDGKTNRKKQDIQAEVVRGYAVAKSVLDRALERHADNWQLKLSKACIMHDENAFLQQVTPSSEFSDRRQAAFDLFSESATSYANTVADLPEREQSNDAFDHWFYASLGASDLAGVSEENRADAKQIASIKASMDSLTGEVGQRHRERFANALFTRMSSVSPACKFRYLNAGFKIVDANDPKSVEARKVYDYYKDLVTELELVTRIDGDSRVGHTDAFGVYVDLRHTKELERESGGFSKYLQNQKSGYSYSYNYGRPTENYRDKFQDAATAALEEQFEILSVTFNHPDTKSRDAGGGWRVTPYAFLLLKARGPEVDKLPSLKLDLDFMDTSGYVVLPIDSSPVPIDASQSNVSSGSAGNVEMVQLLDERQAEEGKLIVEAKVTARGLVPNLESLVDAKVEGFELSKSEDSGVSVIEFDKESVDPIVLSERSWTLEFSAADPAAPAPTQFAFPAPVAEMKEVAFQRYVDADLEDVDAIVPLVQDYGSNQRYWRVAGICVMVGLVVLVGLTLAVRSAKTKPQIEPVKTVDTVTPFGLLSRLRSVQETSQIASDRRSQLVEDIAAIEGHFFAASDAPSAPDLKSIAERWT